MKKLFSLLIVLLIAAMSMGISKCSLSNIYPEPAVPVCSVHPEAVLCKLFAYVGVEAEQVNDMLLDATLFSAGVSVVEAKEIVDVIDSVMAYVEEYGTISFDEIAIFAIEKADVNPAFALLLSRRLNALTNIPEISDLALDPASRKMVLDHLQKNRDQFAWFNRSR
jgi:hypothetical protein